MQDSSYHGFGADRTVMPIFVFWSREAEEARELLSDNIKMPVMQAQIVDRVAMRRAVMAGCGITELTCRNYNDIAASEIIVAMMQTKILEPCGNGTNTARNS